MGLVAGLLLGGCGRTYLPLYGHAAPDGSYRWTNLSPVTVPPNAPSILNGYKGLPPGREETPEDMIHEGVDIYAAHGTPVLAPAAGVVTASYWDPMNGNNLVLDHGKGPGGLYVRTRFKHLEERMVLKGDQVERGQQIGKLGRTGLLAGGILHLHYELRVGARRDQLYFKPLNPNDFWYDGAGIVTCYDEHREFRQTPFRTTYPVLCAEPDP